MTVFIQGGTGEPSQLLQMLSTIPEASDGVHYVGVFIPGINDFNPARFHSGARFSTFFVHGDLGSPDFADRVRFLPMHYRAIYDYLAALPRIDVALIQVSRPDHNGLCSLGPAVDFVPAILDKTQLLVAEINSQMPNTLGAPALSFTNLDYVLETDHALPSPKAAPSSEQLLAVAENVAQLIRDGDTLQTGIGKLPAAILQNLKHHQHLGLHSGMMTAEVQNLIEAGVMTGGRKSIDRGRHVAGIAYGESDLYEWAAHRSDFEWRSVDYTHDIRTLSRIDNFVALNSALEVDLLGQANAEMIAGRQISASGGLLDFIRGARLSHNGRSILALPATAAGGSVSKVVSRLSHDSVVTIPRNDIDYVVTEHGIAHLSGASTEERARRMIDIAAPQFRDYLWQEWEFLQSKRV